ncbi:MAG: hypothetical protein M3Y91_07660 [Actinomycetota bacterium]|nr:hypothetical protein [Actinomycetota bacterium]
MDADILAAASAKRGHAGESPEAATAHNQQFDGLGGFEQLRGGRSLDNYGRQVDREIRAEDLGDNLFQDAPPLTFKVRVNRDRHNIAVGNHRYVPGHDCSQGRTGQFGLAGGPSQSVL